MASRPSFLKPPDLPPAELFRTLTEWRPRRSVDLDLRGVGLFRAEITAAPSIDFAGAFGSKNPELHFIHAALCVDGERVFGSPRHAGEVLDENESKALGMTVLRELVGICPMYGVSDSEAWGKKIAEGAAQHVAVCMALDSCVEYASTPEWIRTLERPQMYWGKPLCELLDGHWMVFRAAREVMERERKKVSPSPKARSPRANLNRR